MKNIVYIFAESLKATWQDFNQNRFRSFLSLFGITIGIFCMIGVLSAINSLERNIKKDLSNIGSNTLFISKWEWTPSTSNYPTWKFAQRPTMKIEDAKVLKDNAAPNELIAYTASVSSNIEKNNLVLGPVMLYASEFDFLKIQELSIAHGRYLTMREFSNGSPFVVIGFNNAKTLFGKAEQAIGQSIRIKESELQIIGVLQEYGKNILQGWDYDNCAIIPYKHFETKMSAARVDPFIMAKNSGVEMESFHTNLRSSMRSIRKLSPKDADNFSVNNISVFTESISNVTNYVQLGGSVIAFFSLLVGAFGIANIMYVSVKERTKVIGLKKALGATSGVITLEFLLESVFLCLIGGAIGLILLFLAAIFFSKLFGFQIEIRWIEVLSTVTLCSLVGVLSGYFPARKAAQLNPVVAIRS